MPQNCDVAYLSHMKVHHQMSIDMARMALEKSTHPQLRQLATKMGGDKNREVTEFDAMLVGSRKR